MLAARWHARRDVRVEEVARPVPGPGEVLLDVGWAGICGTDVAEYLEGPVVIPVGVPNRLTGQMAPVTIGHEFAGTVRQLGPGVGGVHVGDPVAVEACLACGTCSYCRSGRPALCIDWAVYGLQADGGLAESVVVLAGHCAVLPTQIDLRSAALLEPTEVAVRAISKLHVRPGESALVLGGGTIGLLAAQVLRVAGAGPVLLVTASEVGSAAAAELGLTVIPAVDGWQAAVIDRLNADGPDVVVECQGRPTSARDAIRVARKGGRIVLVGLSSGELPVDLLEMTIGEKQVIGSIQHELEADLRPAMELLRSGAVRVEPLISAEITLDRAVPDGLEALAAERRHIKVLVRAN